MNIMNHYQQLPKLSQTTHKFRDFCKLIQTKPLLIEAKQFLKLTIKDKNKKIKPQILLTIFLLSKYPTFVLNDDKTDENLKILCKTIIQNIDNYFTIKNETTEKSENLLNIIKKMILLFFKKFTNWKKQDLQSQLIYYSNSYYEFEEIKKKAKHESYQIEINKLQQKLLHRIKKLDKQKGETFLQQYQKTYENKKKIEKQFLLKTLSHNMKKAFWKKVTQELQEKPPNLTTIPSILKDINIAFHTLVPTNQKYKKNIDEYIDYEYLQQLIEKNSFTYNHIFSLASFMITTLKELGMAEKDEEIVKLQKWIQKTKNNPTEFNLHLFLPKLFQEVFTRIEEIQRRILYITQKKKINFKNV